MACMMFARYLSDNRETINKVKSRIDEEYVKSDGIVDINLLMEKFSNDNIDINTVIMAASHGPGVKYDVKQNILTKRSGEEVLSETSPFNDDFDWN